MAGKKPTSNEEAIGKKKLTKKERESQSRIREKNKKEMQKAIEGLSTNLTVEKKSLDGTVREVNFLFCSYCNKPVEEKGFYISYSLYNLGRGRQPICKDCLVNEVFPRTLDKFNGDIESAIYDICRHLDVPFFKDLVFSSMREVEQIVVDRNEYVDFKSDMEQIKMILRHYMKNLGMINYLNMTFENGEKISQEDLVLEYEKRIADDKCNDQDKQNERDVIRILGFDPFEDENVKDRKFLFNRIVDMLTDSVLGDNIKLMSLISVIKTFNQIENIDIAIAQLSKDTNRIADNSGNIKTLVTVKKDLNKTALDLCADNGLSEKYNSNKSVGAGTLSGKIKEMHELKLEEEQTNLYDIETSHGMQQVAEMSANAIINRLNLNESELTDMLARQREIVYNSQIERDKFKEQARLLRVEMEHLKKKYNITEKLSFEELSELDNETSDENGGE